MGYTAPPAFAAGVALPAASLTILGNDIVDLDARTKPSSASVTTNQTTTSTSYTDLATVGPVATLVTGTAALVAIFAALSCTAGGTALMGFAVSGATVLAASDTQALSNPGTTFFQFGVLFEVTGLTPGTNTFTVKYRVTGATGSFVSRQIVVWPGNKLS